MHCESLLFDEGQRIPFLPSGTYDESEILRIDMEKLSKSACADVTALALGSTCSGEDSEEVAAKSN